MKKSFLEKLMLEKPIVKASIFKALLLLFLFWTPKITIAYDTVFVATNFTTHLLFEDTIIHTECLPAISPVSNESGYILDSVMQVGL